MNIMGNYPQRRMRRNRRDDWARRLVAEIGEMRNRVAVLERLATDPATRLDREISALGASSTRVN